MKPIKYYITSKPIKLKMRIFIDIYACPHIHLMMPYIYKLPCILRFP